MPRQAIIAVVLERTARRAAVALIAPLLMMACASTPPPAAPVVAGPDRRTTDVTPALPGITGECTAAKNLDWLASVDEVRLSVFETGHGGIWTLHTVLRRQDAEFVGFIIAAHALRPDGPIKSASRMARVDAKDVVELLQMFRAGAQAEERPSAEQQVIVDDSSRTEHIQLDALAPNADRPRGSPPHRVQFFVDEGQSEPQPWHLRGCERPVAFHAQKTMTAALAKLTGPLGWTDLATKLKSVP